MLWTNFEESIENWCEDSVGCDFEPVYDNFIRSDHSSESELIEDEVCFAACLFGK